MAFINPQGTHPSSGWYPSNHRKSTHPPVDGIYESTENPPIPWMVSTNPQIIHPSTSGCCLLIHRKSTEYPHIQWMASTNPQKIHRISIHPVDGIHQSTEYPSIQWMASTNPQKIYRILEVNPYGWELWDVNNNNQNWLSIKASLSWE